MRGFDWREELGMRSWAGIWCLEIRRLERGVGSRLRLLGLMMNYPEADGGGELKCEMIGVDWIFVCFFRVESDVVGFDRKCLTSKRDAGWIEMLEST